jgi:heterodisulfide reductase subunit A-like polyferredoxin
MSYEGSTNLPTTIKVRPSNSAPANLTSDICVVGAGISGVSAAIEAARLGRKVVLVDGLPGLGGQAVSCNMAGKAYFTWAARCPC